MNSVPSGWVSDQDSLETQVKTGLDTMLPGSEEKNRALLVNGQGQEIRGSLVFLRWEKTNIRDCILKDFQNLGIPGIPTTHTQTYFIYVCTYILT